MRRWKEILKRVPSKNLLISIYISIKSFLLTEFGRLQNFLLILFEALTYLNLLSLVPMFFVTLVFVGAEFYCEMSHISICKCDIVFLKIGYFLTC